MFRTSLPVTALDFYDREEPLARLAQVVQDLGKGVPRWVAIVGSRKVGKTSLLWEASRRAERSDLRFVTLDVMETLPISPAFFRRYALRVLDRVLAPLLGASVETLAEHGTLARDTLLRSDTFEALGRDLRADILALFDPGAGAEYERTALALPERLAESLGLWVVVAIDEFQELASTGSRSLRDELLQRIRSLWQQHKRTTYVISGSARSMLTELVTAQHSPFFQHFDLMELSAFDQDDAVRLLVELSPPGRRIPETLARSAARVLGGHPFYLQLLGETLTSAAPPYDEQALKLALQRLVFSATGRLGLYYQNEFARLVGRSSTLAATLEALSEGPCRLTDIAKRIGASSGAMARYLERLGDAARKLPDGRYALADATFGMWLSWRKPGGSVVPMRVIGDEAELRVAEHLASLGFDLVYQSRASRGAFDLLATRAAHQLGIQVKRSALPLSFSRTAWSRMAADAKHLQWRWVVAAVSPRGEVSMLDPARARKGRNIRLAKGATIDNLLAWIDA
ncbi:MAG: ATP-binding protein [Proteobacteria bacterium]|nr:ATP-binding protein [Pseudomonadota bacterium]